MCWSRLSPISPSERRISVMSPSNKLIDQGLKKVLLNMLLCVDAFLASPTVHLEKFRLHIYVLMVFLNCLMIASRLLLMPVKLHVRRYNGNLYRSPFPRYCRIYGGQPRFMCLTSIRCAAPYSRRKPSITPLPYCNAEAITELLLP